MTEKTGMQNQSPNLPTTIPQYVYPDDEINLIDIWLVIVKHKKIFWYVFGALLVLSFIAALVIPKKYTLTSTIAIGQITQDDKTVLLESPETVKAKLENALVPMILNQYEDDDIRTKEFVVSAPKNSDLVLIKTKITEDEIQEISSILTKLSDAIEKDHERLLKPIKASITAAIKKKQLEIKKENDDRFIEPIIKEKDSQLTIAKADLKILEDPVFYEYKKQALEIQLQAEVNKLASLKESETILKKKQERLKSLNDLLLSQINELKDQIKSSKELQKANALQTKSGEQGITMMLENELQQNRSRLSELEERLYIDLETQYSDLNKEINDNTRDQDQQNDLIDEKQKDLEKFKIENQIEVEKQKSQISKIEAEKTEIQALREQNIDELKQELSDLKEKSENIIDTRTVAEPLRSQKPTSISKFVILLLGLIVGVVIGLFATFIAEFAFKVSLSKESHAK